LSSGTESSEVEVMMKEEDVDDVIFEQEEAPPSESIKWMAIARVHMVKPYNQFCFNMT